MHGTDGGIAGRGVNQVGELRDPTAQAEVLALRAAGRALGGGALAVGAEGRVRSRRWICGRDIAG